MKENREIKKSYTKDYEWNKYLNKLINDKIANGDYNLLDNIYDAMSLKWGEFIPCSQCNSLQRYEIIENNENLSLGYNLFECVCTKCGSKNEPLILYNINSSIKNSEKLRNNNIKDRLILHSMIREIPLKYNIDIESLSLVLELNRKFSTYYEYGFMPGFSSREDSQTLLNIYNNPALFLELLEKNEDKISKEAFLNSLQATKYLVINSLDTDSIQEKKPLSKVKKHV